MDGVVCRAVDKRELEGDAVVDVDGPQTHARESHEVRHVVHGHQKHEDVIRTPSRQGRLSSTPQLRASTRLFYMIVHNQ